MKCSNIPAIDIPCQNVVTVTRHVTISVDFLLSTNKSLDGFFTDKETGDVLNDAQAREVLQEMKNEGQKKICLSNDCEGFDPITGCPGHPSN